MTAWAVVLAALVAFGAGFSVGVILMAVLDAGDDPDPRDAELARLARELTAATCARAWWCPGTHGHVDGCYAALDGVTQVDGGVPPTGDARDPHWLTWHHNGPRPTPQRRSARGRREQD